MKTKLKKLRFFLLKIFNIVSDTTSFKRRMFMSFLLIAIPILSGVCAVAILVVQKSSRQLIRQTQATELEKINAQLESIFSDTENMSRELIYNSVIQNYMQQASNTDTYPEDSDALYYINGLITNREYVSSIVLSTTSKTVLSTENAYSDRSSFQNIEEKWWYPALTASDLSYKWFPYSQLTASLYESQQNSEIPRQINSLMLARPVYSISDYHTVIGYLMIYLDEEYMEDIWQSISWGQSANIFIFDENFELITANSRMQDYSDLLSDPSSLTESQIVHDEDEQYVVSSTDMNVNHWKIYMITPLTEVNSNAVFMMTILVCIMCAIVFVLFFMSKYSANNMARPVISLSKMMDSYHGSDQEKDEAMVSLYRERSDEIGQIYRSYEQLEDRMNRLIQEIYVKNLEKKDAELALLQSQINPHFLYNTLDSINWMALANDQEEISDMITALSDTFRLSLMKNNKSFIEMDQEIQHIKSFLVLQKFRYADRLNYEFDIPDPLPSLYIPRFILQPIVENALKHGIDRQENGGKLLIRISVGDQVLIYVINDGNQINLEKMKRLLVFDPNDSDILNFKKEGYGVQNIHRRIKIICGDPYGLSYTKTGSQTICKIILPKKETA